MDICSCDYENNCHAQKRHMGWDKNEEVLVRYWILICDLY